MGAHFDVDVQDDVVIKKPKRNTIHEIRRMVDLQNWLAERIDGIPTAEVYNGAIYEQKIYGSTLREINPPRSEPDKATAQLDRRIRKEASDIVDKIAEHGYRLTDHNPKNIMYEPSTDKVYVIDFYGLYKIDPNRKRNRSRGKKAWEF